MAVRYFGRGKAGGGVSLTTQGDRELIAMLSKFRQGESNRIIRKGLRAGAKIVQTATKNDAPVRSGATKKSFKVRAMKRKRGRLGIMVQSGKGFFKGDTFYVGFLVFGHRVGPRRLGDSRTKVLPNEFMKRAARRSEKQAVEELNTTVRKEIEKLPTKVKVKS